MKIKKDKNKLVYSVNLGLVFLMFILLFFHLFGTTESAKEGFVLGDLDLELKELQNQNKELQLKSAEMQSIARIKEKAINDLKMIPSEGNDYIVLRGNQNIAKR